MRLAPLLLGLALASTAPAMEGFESGLGGWSASGLWHRVVAPSCFSPHEGTAAVYFGLDEQCDYNDHLVKDASFSSGPLNLTDTATAFISFWMLSQVESLQPSCYDQLRLERSFDGSNWALLRDLSPSSDPVGGGPGLGWASGGGLGGPPLWQFVKVDLSAYVPSTLYLRFRFVSSASQAGDPLCGPPDADLDAYLGVALDEIRVNEAGPRLSLSKSVDPGFGAPGSTLTYTLVARNDDSATQTLSLWDTLPAGLLYVGADNGPTGPVGGLLSWNSLPPLAPGAAITVHLSVQADPSLAAPADRLNSAAALGGASPLVQASNPALFRLRAAGLRLSHSAAPASILSGERATYNLLVENYSPLTQSALSLACQLPSGLVFNGAYPGQSGAQRWDLGPLGPGEIRGFSLWGRGYGEDGAVLTVSGSLTQGGAPVDQKSASVTVHKPLEPTVRVKAVYPNPAPSDKPGLPQSAFVYYELNLPMPMILDIFTLAGEKVRSLEAPGAAGSQQVEWDLKNDWGQGVASGVYAYRLWSKLLVIPTPEAFGFIAVLR